MATTDDEAFIRAIVDAPGDDGPRLVYADWLDERGDPRGGYVRAELNWYQARRSRSSLLPPTSGLNPVWLCRVSRPPLGICSERSVFSDTGPPLTWEDVRLVEKRLGTDLSSDYRAFLLNVNGGTTDRSWSPDRGLLMDVRSEPRTHRFYSAYLSTDPVAEDEDRSLLAAAAALWHRVGDRAADYLPIARLTSGAEIALGVGGRNWGRVFLVPETWSGPPAEIGSCLSDVWGRMKTPAPIWLSMVAAGDLAGTIRWLDREHSPRPDHGRVTLALVHAVRHRQSAIVRELLARGADVPHPLWELADQLGDTETAEALRAAGANNPSYVGRRMRLDTDGTYVLEWRTR
jgi:uncharacterized protein (TIGR02996 family)